jgi:RimJ/RimL family protein N-acetyltransferase
VSLGETLEGRIVRLEPLEPRHAEPLWRAAQDPLTWRYFRVRGDESRDAFDRWFAETLTFIPFATISIASGEAIGSTSFANVREHDRVVEIGNTWLVARAWGTGANDEAKLLMLEHAFEREGFYRVEFKTEATNERSRAALLAIGATFEGIHRKHMVVRGGERRDSAWYSVIDDEWPAVKERLRERVASRPS